MDDPHRIQVTIDDGLVVKLICPESGCKNATICAACGRDVSDPEVEGRCYDCPDPNSKECWVRGWFDNAAPDELIHDSYLGDFVVDVEWDGEGPIITVPNPAPHLTDAQLDAVVTACNGGNPPWLLVNDPDKQQEYRASMHANVRGALASGGA